MSWLRQTYVRKPRKNYVCTGCGYSMGIKPHWYIVDIYDGFNPYRLCTRCWRTLEKADVGEWSFGDVPTLRREIIVDWLGLRAKRLHGYWDYYDQWDTLEEFLTRQP